MIEPVPVFAVQHASHQAVHSKRRNRSPAAFACRPHDVLYGRFVIDRIDQNAKHTLF
jgi:hypothetical protein